MDPETTTERIFPAVLTRTATGFCRVIVPLCAAVVVVAFLAFLLSTVQVAMVGEEPTGIGFAGSTPELEALAGRIEEGDPTVQQEMVALVYGAGDRVGGASAGRLWTADAVLPYAISMAGSLLVLAFGLAAFIGIALRSRGLRGVLLHAVAVLPAMLLLLLFILLRSLVWIWFLAPFFPEADALLQVAAVLCGIVLLPRLLLAPVILVAEGRGIAASVRESRLRTRGHWFSIAVSVTILLLFLSIASLALVPAILDVLEYISFAYVLGGGVTHLLVAVFAVFLVQLYSVRCLST